MLKAVLILCLLAIVISPVFGEKVTIKVVDPGGKPVPGAQVIVSDAKTCPMPGAAAPRTNALGVYTADVKGRAVGYVYVPGYVEMARVLKTGENLFKLEPAGQVWGSVVDPQGKPVAGATVRLVDVRKADGSRFSYG